VPLNYAGHILGETHLSSNLSAYNGVFHPMALTPADIMKEGPVLEQIAINGDIHFRRDFQRIF
jgi:hypothetical protein